MPPSLLICSTFLSPTLALFSICYILPYKFCFSSWAFFSCPPSLATSASSSLMRALLLTMISSSSLTSRQMAPSAPMPSRLSTPVSRATSQQSTLFYCSTSARFACCAHRRDGSRELSRAFLFAEPWDSCEMMACSCCWTSCRTRARSSCMFESQRYRLLITGMVISRKSHMDSYLYKNRRLQTSGALSSWKSTFRCSWKVLMLIFYLAPPSCPYCFSSLSFSMLSASPSLLGLNLYFRNFRLALSLRSLSKLPRNSFYRVLLSDLSLSSIRAGSVITSRIESGFDFPEPFLLTTGIYEPEPWLSLPSGIDVEYLRDDSSTGGRPSEFILSFISQLLLGLYSDRLLYFTMGLLKIAALIVGPVAGMTYAAFSLGRQLPKATRRFGNYIGLSYVYFKTVLKVLKPEDQMPYQIIEVARKASQQSQALRRQLRNTIVKAKEDFKAKHDETMSNFESKIKQAKTNPIVVAETQGGTQGSNDSGSHTMKEILLLQTQLLEKRRLKVESRKFFDEL